MFDDLKSSVEKTYGKQFDLRTFQQLLYVCPHFYTHTWVKKPRAYNQLTLLIDFGEGCHHLGQGQLDARQAEMRGRLLSVARGHYEVHMGKYLSEKGSSGLLAVTVRDPFESGMWHHSFDPHSIPDVPAAPLNPMPTSQFDGLTQKTRGNETVRDFLDRSNIMRELPVDASVTPIKVSHSKEVNFEELSKKTGLSIPTL